MPPDIVITVREPRDWDHAANALSRVVRDPLGGAVCIRPPPDVIRSLPLGAWVELLVRLLHRALPVPHYDGDPYDWPVGGPGAGAVDLLTLNAAPPWRLVLDLSDGPCRRCAPAESPPTLDAALLEALCRIMCDGTAEQAARREWVLQLFEAGQLRLQLPTAAAAVAPWPVAAPTWMPTTVAH